LAFINLAQIGGGVFALTIAGTVFQNVAYDKLDKALSGEGFSDADIRSAIAGTQSAIFRRGSEEVRDAAVKTVIEAIRNVYILTIVAGVVLSPVVFLCDGRSCS
jgi:hypothetical protein